MPFGNLNLFPFAQKVLFILIISLSVIAAVKILLNFMADKKEMDRKSTAIELEPLDRYNRNELLNLKRQDIPLNYAADVADIINRADYNAGQGLKGVCFAIKYNKKYVGIISMGETLEEKALPYELQAEKHYNIIDFIIDSRYHRIGIGSFALNIAIDILFNRYGDRAILAQCHKDNEKALLFFEKNDFKNTGLLNDTGDSFYLIF